MVYTEIDTKRRTNQIRIVKMMSLKVCLLVICLSVSCFASPVDNPSQVEQQQVNSQKVADVPGPVNVVPVLSNSSPQVFVLFFFRRLYYILPLFIGNQNLQILKDVKGFRLFFLIKSAYCASKLILFDNKLFHNCLISF